jgi:hypothetical protein
LKRPEFLIVDGAAGLDRVYLSPKLPFGWDFRPSVNRLIGL